MIVMKLLHKAKYVGLVVSLCVLLNLIAYALPINEAFVQNMALSAETLHEEGTYPKILSQDLAQLDNFTDTIILGAAAYDGEESALVKLAANYVPDKPYPDCLYDIYCTKTGGEYHRYSRYWHGYVFFVKSLLYFMSYGSIRQLNSFAQTAFYAIILVLFVKKKRAELVIPYTVLWLFLNPAAVQASLQYSSVYYVFSIATILLLSMREKIKKSIGVGYSVFFMLIGIITSWLDLLTYPIITLGIPLTVLLIMEDASLKEKVKLLFSLSFMWACGYLGMWGLKWVLSSIILGENIIQDAVNSARFRTSVSLGELSWTRWDTISKILRFIQLKTYYVLFAVPLCYGVIKAVKNHSRVNWRDGILCGLISMMPFAWYIVLNNHSYIHYVFTFRSMGVAVFALSCFFVNGHGYDCKA